MSSARSLIEQHLASFKTDSEGEGHKLFPRSDWRYEVDNDDTNLGYAQWLEDKIEFEVDEIADGIDRFLLRVSKLPGGEISEIDFNQDVLRCFSDMRLSDDEAAERAEQFLQEPADRKIFGEVFGSVPPDIALQISRIAHLGMVFFEGRCETEKLLNAAKDFCDQYDVTGDAITSLNRSLGLDDDLEI